MQYTWKTFSVGGGDKNIELFKTQIASEENIK